jgi:hypothetical protein
MDKSLGSKPIRVDYQLIRNGLLEPEPRRSSVAARSAVMLAFVAMFLAGLTLTPPEVRNSPKRGAETLSHVRASQTSPVAMSVRQVVGESRTR